MDVEVLSEATIEQFRSHGFVVLHDVFDPAPLVAEVADALRRGFAHVEPGNVSAEASISFRYLPLMCERAPVSLGLLDRFGRLAEQVLDTVVLPVRAKAVEYHGESRWHRDSELAVASVGFACYLEPLDGDSGALRVLPCSHRDDDIGGLATIAESEHAVATDPGDVIVFDEHLVHASRGGQVRRQWRVDFVARPTTSDERAVLRAYFAAMFSPDWDGGYDVDAYPTYGDHWRRACAPADDALLDAVGAYDAAAEEEGAASRRRSHRDEAG